MATSVENRIAQAMSALQARGYTPEQAAGVVGNWIAESNMSPMVVQNKPGTYDDDGTTQDVLSNMPGPNIGYSYPQFTSPDRQKAFQKFVESLPKDISAEGVALLGALNELDTQGYEAGFKSKPDLLSATRYGFANYERPKSSQDKFSAEFAAELDRRREAAEKALGYATDAPFSPSYHTFSPDQNPNEAGVAAARMAMAAPAPAPGSISAGMSFTPPLPGAMPDVAGPLTPGYNFSPGFSSMGFNPQFAQPVTPQNPPAATQPTFANTSPPGWGSIAGNAIRDFASPTFSDSRASREPDGWNTPSPGLGNTPGPGMPAVSTPDYTTGSNGTFQSAPPSTMSAPGPTGATLAGDAISAARPVAGPLTPGYAFSSMKPKASAIAAAVADADAKAAAEAKAEMDRETARAKALSGLPQDDLTTATPVDAPAPKAPQVQKVMPRIAPRPVVQPPHPPSTPMTQKALNAYGLGDSPGSQLAAQIGTPNQFMGSGTSPQNFAKALTAISAITGNNLANVYASQLSSERPGISGVAFDALQNQYAKATNQPQTKGLLSGLLGDIGQAFGYGTSGAYGTASNPLSDGYMAGYGLGDAPSGGGFFSGLTNTLGGWGGGGFADNSRPGR